MTLENMKFDKNIKKGEIEIDNETHLLAKSCIDKMEKTYLRYKYKSEEIEEPNNPRTWFCGQNLEENPYDVNDALEFICNYKLGIFDMGITEKGKNFLIHSLNCTACSFQLAVEYNRLLEESYEIEE